ncbi:IS21-like element helper ATPase IstB [Virgibacillus natechei]|uniref:IS21-like element helper ATPase IstB n=1 Tax=Virgibacillus natechei TaxID=1216297 RepID=UPI0022303936|nr:IS21-like element helper ATPase IstB [Virgibacillus natechei]UZD12011.1 IS21-like element helper ATPase IstB [Virgibacillus natechei]
MSNLIREKCKSLRLAYVADIYEQIPFENPEQYISALLQQELEHREVAKGERLIKKAKFMNEKDLEDYRWSEHIRFPPQLDRESLESLYFIDKKENLILTGAPGTGKSHLVTALGRKACRSGYEVRFYRVADLVELLEKSWREGRFQALRNRFNKVDMVILDEMGYVPFSKEGAELLFQLISDWYERSSLVITSNLEFSQWNRIFVDARLTVALVDRVIHHAHILSFTGDSYRVTHALSNHQS